jgi:hypothetical protein
MAFLTDATNFIKDSIAPKIVDTVLTNNIIFHYSNTSSLICWGFFKLNIHKNLCLKAPTYFAIGNKWVTNG